MVPLAAACGNSGCNESCGEEEKDDNTDSASSGSSGSEGAAGGDSSGSSVCSADVSFSDSGRGTSEDDCHAMALASLNNHRNGEVPRISVAVQWSICESSKYQQ